MKIRNNIFIIVSVVMMCASELYAMTYAWLIDSENKAYKLDISTNKILKAISVEKGLVSSSILQEIENGRAIDTVRNLVFIIYDYKDGLSGQGVKVYDLKSLSFKKDLGIMSEDPDGTLPRLLIPPASDIFYVLWSDNSKKVLGKSGLTYSAFDKKTLSKVEDLTSFPIDFMKPWVFSRDGAKIYSIDIDRNEIKGFDSKTLTLVETINISNLWGVPLYGKQEVCNVNDKILFTENLKNSDDEPNNIKYFIYNVTTKEMSEKFKVTESGIETVTPDTSKLILTEVMNEYVGQTISGIRPLNRISIYSITKGVKVTAKDYSSKYDGIKVAGVSPDNTKLYMYANNKITSAATLIVINLIDYSILAEIPIEASLLTFFDE